jgi:hypothetical protein
MIIQSPFKIQKNLANITYHNYACLHRTASSSVSNAFKDCDCKQKINNTDKHKYLGIIIDCQFKWESHINGLCGKLRSGLYNIRLLKYHVNKKLLRTVYCALMESHIRYGILSWGRASKSLLKQIVKIQNSFVKILNPVTLLSKNSPNSDDLHIMTIQQLHYYNFVLTYFFSKTHKLYRNSKQITTNKDKLIAPDDINNLYGFQQRKYLTPFFFNLLPNNILKIKKYSELKLKLKKWVMKHID